MRTMEKNKKKRKNKVKLYHSTPDRILTASVWVLLLLIMIVILVPLLFILASSFSDPSAVSAGKVLLWPVDFSLVGYEAIFQSPSILRGFINSVEYTLAGTVISVTLTLFAGYPLSRVDLKIRGPVMFLFTVTMFFSGGIIPLYLIINTVGIYDSIWAMILPTAVSVYNLIVCRSFFDSNIPDELYDASKIDGCNDFDFFFRVAVPLSSTIIAVMLLFYATSIWNSFMNALMFMGTQDKMPLQVILRNLVLSNQTSALTSSGTEVAQRMKMAEQLKYSIIVVSALPLLVAYPFVQKYFAKGVLMGAVKG